MIILQGELVSQEPWYNLSCQSPQPSMRPPPTTYNPFTDQFHLASHVSDPQPPLVASLCSDTAFRLGSCLHIQGEATQCCLGSVL